MKSIRTGIVLLFAVAAFGQSAASKPSNHQQSTNNAMIAFDKEIYSHLQGILLRSAEKMPEENYNFKPVDGVRTYGQILGHVADAQYTFCSIALGEKDPDLNIEKTKTSKAALMSALKTAFSYCDKAYDSMSETSATQRVPFMGGDTPKLGVLNVNSLHSVEHYGNLVTYMRMKNIVPPTSEHPMPEAKK
jgi:uncharacterized damage-inducible protein DinB